MLILVYDEYPSTVGAELHKDRPLASDVKIYSFLNLMKAKENVRTRALTSARFESSTRLFTGM
jgi:hypothetical protein